MAVTIDRVENGRELRTFIKVPWTVYKDDPCWVPWLYFERLHFFDKTKNPFFEHAEADYFIARRDGRPVGTIAAILNHRHNEFHQEKVGHFGVFEVLNDPEAAAALLATAVEWARERGLERILGPMSLSTNDECGTLIDGFNDPPRILMTYNPPYYIPFIEGAGFVKAMDLYAWRHDVQRMATPGGLPEKVYRVVERVKERYKLRIRPLNMKEWDTEIEHVKRIYNSAWEKNWGFVPMTDPEIQQLADSLKPVVVPEYTFLVEKEGQVVGFSLMVPDVNLVLNRLRPGPSVIGSYIAAARALRNRRKVEWARVIALGVTEPFRGKGVDALMYYESIKASAGGGHHWAEGSWILETNEPMNRAIQMLGADRYKTYRIWQKELAQGDNHG
jgi:GNAT superfamily N-acetyltransferase